MWRFGRWVFTVAREGLCNSALPPLHYRLWTRSRARKRYPQMVKRRGLRVSTDSNEHARLLTLQSSCVKGRKLSALVYTEGPASADLEYEMDDSIEVEATELGHNNGKAQIVSV